MDSSIILQCPGKEPGFQDPLEGQQGGSYQILEGMLFHGVGAETEKVYFLGEFDTSLNMSCFYQKVHIGKIKVRLGDWF